MRRSVRLQLRMSNISTSSKGKQSVSNSSTHLRPPKWQFWVPPGDIFVKKAKWDSENSKIFLDLLVEEVTTSRRGEAPIVNKEGFSNVSKKIFERTHIYLEYRQLKNKYDSLKKDWQAWSFLENPKYGVTGIGYDYATGTWNASDEWWDMMIQMRPEVAKWRHEGIPYIDEMRAVFQGVTAKTHHVWTPGETRGPFVQSMPPMTETIIEDVEMGDNEEDPYQEAFNFQGGSAQPISPSPPAVPLASPCRRSPRLQSRNATPVAPGPPTTSVAKNLFNVCDSAGSSRGKKRSTPSQAISGSISEVATQLGKNVRGYGIPEAMELLKCLPGAPMGSELYWNGLNMIFNDRKRVAFLNMDSDEMRLEMVKKCGGSSTRND